MHGMTPTPTDDRFRLLVEGIRDYGIFMLDPAGHIVSWNVGASLIKGYSAAEIIGRHFSAFYPQDAIDRGWPSYELERAATDGRFEDENWRLKKDGSRFWARVVITAVRDEKGALVGFSKVTSDLTERRRHEEALRLSEERFRLLVDGVRDYAIIMLDREGHIRTWNSGAQLTSGYSADEIIGRHFSLLYPQDANDRGWPRHELTVATIRGRYEEEGWRIRRDGSRFFASVIIAAVYDAEGALTGFAKVTRDITDRQRLEALVKSTREMTEFLAMLSHELRNPLAPIRNAVAVLELQNNDDPTIKWGREVIARQTAQLSHLVDDLLDVSRMASGKIVLDRQPMDLRAIVAHAFEASLPQTAQRNHVLSVNLPETAIWVNGDALRLTQVVTNLLTNAIKYTPEGGRIGVSLFAVDNSAQLHVIDTGVGLREDQLEQVFDLFAQGERSLARSEGGLGVGLTLVRRLVEMHDGSVVARSEGVGQGSSFEVCIPLLARSEEDIAQDAEPPAAITIGSTSQFRILVVDDNVDSARSMMTLLSLKGHQVHCVFDGESAVAEIASFMPHLVLLDIGLPGMSGYDVARAIKTNPENENVVLCAVTGYGQNEDRRRSRDAGFEHHLVKPVDIAELDAVIDTLPDLVRA